MIPNKDQAIVAPLKENDEVQKDGLIQPEDLNPTKDKPKTAIVKFTHPDEAWLKIGDEVLLSRFAGKELPGHDDLVLVSTAECLAILNRSE